MAKSKTKAPILPGSNWAALQAQLATAPGSSHTGRQMSANGIGGGEMSSRQRKKAMYRSLMAAASTAESSTGKPGESSTSAATVGITSAPATHAREMVTLLPVPSDCTDQRLVEELRTMVAGKAVLNEAKRAPGNYIALDCEMVGLGPLGSESCLARISVVNYHGHILLDTFVQPREMVTDWRTWISGIRASDMVGAPVFDVVQKQVAELCEGRIVVGHALENDMKALLLSHPGPMTRDTQICKALREKAKTKKPGLKKLAEMELGIRIQTGAHSSVTDARATMALYRLHKTVWEQQLRPTTEAYREKMGLPNRSPHSGKGKEKSASVVPDTATATNTNIEADAGEVIPPAGKRKREERFEDEGGLLHRAESEDKWKQKKANKKAREVAEGNPGGGTKGISSGISEVIRYRDGTKEIRGRQGQVISTSKAAGNWWEENAAS